MRVVNVETIQQFGKKHPDARKWLTAWMQRCAHATWENLLEVRGHYPHADGVNTRTGVVTIFNVRGNEYRLLTAIHYRRQQIVVLAVMTHAEYDQERWKQW